MSDQKVMIDLQNVSKWYGDFQVLTDCTTQICQGEVVVVCGPSGSGKSTNKVKSQSMEFPSKTRKQI